MHRIRLVLALAALGIGCSAQPDPKAGTKSAPGPSIAAATSKAAGPPPAPEPETSSESASWNVESPPGEWGWTDVEIDTSTGTWMNVDVSPDGRTIVFDLLGDIYTLPIDGGDATPIVQGIAWSQQPRFSPDGTKIAFTSDAGAGDNLWVANADGSEPRQVTKETFRLINNPAWDPSSRYLAAKKHFTSKRSLGAGEMWLFHVGGAAGGTTGEQMTKRATEQKDVNDPAFSPDGRFLYFNRDASPGRTFAYNKDSSGEIYIIERLDRHTGEVKKITGGAGGAAKPTPSPNGKLLAFVRRVDYDTTLFVRDLNSGVERPIISGLERDNQESWALHGVYPGMAWTPDSTSIVLWDDGQIKRVDIASQAVATVPFRVRSQKRIAKVVRQPQLVAPDTFQTKMLRDVTVSPDGTLVAFVALGHIYVRSLPAGVPKRLTAFKDRFEHAPAFSRDGRSIVFATWNDQKLGELRVAPVRGGGSRVVSPSPGHFQSPEFSPDGRSIVFQKVAAGYLRNPRNSIETGIYRVSLDGGPAERLAETGSAPHFGADSSTLYLTRSSGDETSDTHTLIALDLKTRAEHTLYTSPSVQSFRVSMDGHWLAFQEQFKVFITPLVRTGRTITVESKSKGTPIAKVSKEAGRYLSWGKNSTSLYWTLGPELFERSVLDAFSFLEGAPGEPSETPSAGLPIGFEAKADRPDGTVAFTNARILTMNGDTVIENGTVVVQGNRITAVGPDVAVPADAFIVDARGKTLIPGLIDAHAHGAMGTSGIIPQHHWNQFANLAFGVTTIHDPSNDTEMVFGAAELQRAGAIRAPRIFSTGTILYGAAGVDYKSQVESLDDALFHLSRQQRVGAFSVKSYNQPRRDQRQMVIEAARQLNMQVMPEGGATFMHNMTMVVDGHTTVEHNLPVENIYDDVLQLWSKSDTALTPTLIVSYGGITGEYYWYEKMDVWKHERLARFVPRYVLHPRARRRQKAPEGDYNHFKAARQVKALSDRGRLVNAGAHGQIAGMGQHWEIWMFAQGGLSPLESLRAATLNPARTFGMEAELGSIEVGKLADLVLLDKNPLEDIRNTDSVRMVMLNGRLFNAATMDQIGNEQDTIGSDAFGDGPQSIGGWWGLAATQSEVHTCGCGQH